MPLDTKNNLLGTHLYPVGFIGGGQLARMAGEAASALGLRMALLSEDLDDPATQVASQVTIGSPLVMKDMESFAAQCALITFDHEQLDLDILAHLENSGVLIRPGIDTLRIATDKAQMRTLFQAKSIPVPGYSILGDTRHIDSTVENCQSLFIANALGQIQEFSTRYGWPLILKATRGGYDGKGVWVLDDLNQAESVIRGAIDAGITLLAEEKIAIDAELSVLLARRPCGETVMWDPVETVQIDGVCKEVFAPAPLDESILTQARELAQTIANELGLVGVMAIEMFSSKDRLVVNEIATRPHNSGHWTIEGSTTSQFENHLRAVLDLPLGDTSMRAPFTSTVNIFGDLDMSNPLEKLRDALKVSNAHIHLYQKEPRPGRKLGHVTIYGNDPSKIRENAWKVARSLGSPTPPDLKDSTSIGLRTLIG